MNELTDFQKEYLESLRREELEELDSHRQTIEDFKVFMRSKGLELSDDNFKYYTTSGIIATYPKIITYLDELLQPDKEGLLDFAALDSKYERKLFAKGYLYGTNYMLMAHPSFRRGFHQINNFAPRFVELYWDFKDLDIQKYIALDTDSVRINVDNSAYMEKDTWFGADFDRKIENIPDGIVKLRPPLDLEPTYIRFFFSDAYAIDIKWSTKGNIRTFQAEEFKSEGVTVTKEGTDYFPVRYLHAEFDPGTGCFRHFDGAIHFYTLDEYVERRDSDFNFNAKHLTHIKTRSEKLFKLNGKVSVETWIEFSCHFFTSNPLMFEYFQGSYPDHITEMIEKVRNLPIKS